MSAQLGDVWRRRTTDRVFTVVQDHRTHFVLRELGDAESQPWVGASALRELYELVERNGKPVGQPSESVEVCEQLAEGIRSMPPVPEEDES